MKKPECLRKVFMGDTCRLLGEVIRSVKISAEEPHFAFDVALQQRMAIFIGELAVDLYGGGSRDRRYLTRPFTALLEASNGTIEDDEIRNVGGMAVAVAIDMLEPTLFLELLNQVLIEGHLEFCGEPYDVRLDHHDFNRRGLYLYRRLFLPAQ